VWQYTKLGRWSSQTYGWSRSQPRLKRAISCAQLLHDLEICRTWTEAKCKRINSLAFFVKDRSCTKIKLSWLQWLHRVRWVRLQVTFMYTFTCYCVRHTSPSTWTLAHAGILQTYINYCLISLTNKSYLYWIIYFCSFSNTICIIDICSLYLDINLLIANIYF
jgi:hypothetical protein